MVQPWLDDAVRLKDEMSLRDLARHLSVSVAELTMAFRRENIRRQPSRAPGRTREATAPLVPDPDTTQGVRPGSKDSLIAAHVHLLGKVPDAEVATAAGVSVRTIASYRARNGIVGYKGPRRRAEAPAVRPSRIDPYEDLLGTFSDRAVAEKAGVSVGAVRNYRLKRGIGAAPKPESPGVDAPAPATTSASAGSQAWRIEVTLGAEVLKRIVIADNLVQAAARATELAGSAHGTVTGVHALGEVLA